MRLNSFGSVRRPSVRTLSSVALHQAGGQIDVLVRERGSHVVRRHALCRHLAGVERQAHAVTLLAEDAHAGDPRDGLDAIFYERVGDVGYLQNRLRIAGDRHEHDRVAVGVCLLDDGWVGVGGQPSYRLRDLVAYVVGRGVDVDRELELDTDLTGLLAGPGDDAADAGDACQRLLDRLGDLGVDHLRVGAGVCRRHGHDRRVDRRILAHTEIDESDGAQQHQHDRQHDRQHWPSDARLGQRHGAAPEADGGGALAASALSFTLAPGRRRSRLSTNTTSPSLMPLLI